VNVDKDITITAEQLGDIRRILHGMPYAGMAMFPQGADADTLIKWLRDYQSTIKWIAEENTQREKELDRIKSDVRAAGRLFRMMQED
jgi:hypothetical protein